ncbi:hypothetical protein GOBAR_AA17751 [Gossypium barbadense]|uniref:Uncharacterized protein n=1 Tax=Gossypium barbadense TaxID=3634 RepID=A0A2P5XHR3_GOSBA|nr:hypothetical protein GOBAR_AA17751 [Gossypium barbadense]
MSFTLDAAQEFGVPQVIFWTTSASAFLGYCYFGQVMKRAIILNIFEDLEHQVHHNGCKQLGSNLWKEDPICLEWLDSKQPNSVVYVNFGIITVMTPEQLTEFALSGDTAILPPEFSTVTKDGFGGKLGIAMEINSDVKRDEVAGHVRELMEGEKGKAMKKKALDWKKMAEEATNTPDGSSYDNLNHIINQGLLH